MKIIITTSGIGKRLCNYTKYNNKTLVRVGNKFTICYIIDKYPSNSEFIITLGYYGDLVREFLEIAYPKHNFKWVYIDKYIGEGSSLGYSLLQTKESINAPFIYHCCDCIFLDEIDINEFRDNTMFAWCGVKNSHNSNNFSSINVQYENIYKINDKGADHYDYYYIGVAYIKNYNDFFRILEKLVNGKYMGQSLSDIHVYREFLKSNVCNIKYKLVKDWFDMGTISTFNKANEKLLCNYDVLYKEEESICFLNDSVIKFFFDKTINNKRVERCKYLKELTPKILDHNEHYYKMEFVKGELLSQHYKRGEIYNLLEWTNNNLWKYKGDLNNFSNYNNFELLCKKFYYDKTISRIKKFKKIYNGLDHHIINGINVGSIEELIKKVNFDLLSKSEPSYFHGDFILDNIIKTDDGYCLLDWRQDFSGELEFGDKYYDLAKLKHNIIVNHKNLESNLFTFEQIDNSNCIVDLKCNYFLIEQLKDYDKFIERKGWSSKKINILVALIWINMAPLHEHPMSLFLFHFGKYNLHLCL